MEVKDTNASLPPVAVVPIPQEPPIAPIKKPKKKIWLKIIFVAIIIALIGGLGFFAYRKFVKKSVPKTPIAETPTPTPDPTARWETYTNDKYQYSIKYPEGTDLQEGQKSYENRIQETYLFYPKSSGTGGGFNTEIGIKISILKNPDDKTPKQFADELYELNKKNIEEKLTEGDLSQCKIENFQRSGIAGARFTECVKMPEGGITIFYEWFNHKGNMIQMNASLHKETSREVFNQILSTFKFLDSADETAGWKTYTNAEHGYSVEYPPTWSFREFPGTKDGAGFRPLEKPDEIKYEFININFGKRASSSQSVPLEDYVKKAAIEEIQNYQSLAGIEKVTTKSGLVGYKTTWNVVPMAGGSSKTFVSFPITYFDTKNKAGDTIQISLSDSAYSNVYNQILSTFKFTD